MHVTNHSVDPTFTVSTGYRQAYIQCMYLMVLQNTKIRIYHTVVHAYHHSLMNGPF